MRSQKEKPSEKTLSPGEHLSAVLKDSGMSQVELATIMGRSAQYVQDIIKRRKAMDARLAVELEEALGTPTASDWLMWELDYQKSIMQIELAGRSESGLKRRDVVAEYPFAMDAVKLGWIQDSRDPGVLRQNIQAYLGLAESKGYATHYRTSGALTTAKASVEAWTIRCFQEADRLADEEPLPAFRQEAIASSLVPALQKLMAEEHGVALVPDTLHQHGIRLMVIPSLRKAPIDGMACAHGGQPFVAVSLRHGQLDRFWFVLMHELAHLSLGHEGEQIQYNSFDQRNTATKEEAEADELATSWLIPEDKFNAFVFGDVSTLESIKSFSVQIKRHPAIVIGRLKRDGYLPWTMHAREHVSIRDELAPVKNTV